MHQCIGLPCIAQELRSRRNPLLRKYLPRNSAMNNLKMLLSTGLLASAFLLVAVPAFAAVSLGSASQFAVLAGSNATCTDGTVVGDIGVSPGSAVPYTNTGCTITGAVPPATDAAAAAARADMLATYASFQYLTCIPLTGTLAGVTLSPGVYCLDAVAKTGTRVIGCSALHGGGNGGNDHGKCNQGVGNGAEGCDPGNSNNHNGSNDENGGTPGNPGRKGSN